MTYHDDFGIGNFIKAREENFERARVERSETLEKLKAISRDIGLLENKFRKEELKTSYSLLIGSRYCNRFWLKWEKIGENWRIVFFHDLLDCEYPEKIFEAPLIETKSEIRLWSAPYLERFAEGVLLRNGVMAIEDVNKKEQFDSVFESWDELSEEDALEITADWFLHLPM
ncbi:MAG: hypothetical protein AB7T49_01275 [Oligoflexales bacterium]